MKTKAVIILVLSVLIVTLTVGTVGVAFADEIRLNLIGDEFTFEEKELALANLKEKFEDEEMPTLKSVEKLYDFNDEALYGLYEFENYYMIVIRQTSSILERGEGNSVYYGLEGKKYYGGFGNAYLLDDKGYKSLCAKENSYATEEEVTEMESKMSEARALDYQDYIEALNTPMPLGEANRHRPHYLYCNVQAYHYFDREINIDYCVENNYYGGSDWEYHDSVLYYYEGFEPKKYGYVFMRNFNYGYDLVYPKNVYNACSNVAMVMVLQYYDRMGYNTNLIPGQFGYGHTQEQIRNHPLWSRAEKTMSIIAYYTNALEIGNSSMDGAASYRDINYGFKDYFEAYGIDCQPTHFTSYTNMKGAIDNGNPAIMNVIAGRGWDENNKEEDVSLHNLVAYGYTTNTLGVLDEFICHGGWHTDKDSEGCYTAKLFVNKFYAAGNVYINGIK